MKQTLVPAADVLQVHSCESAVRNRKHRASQGTKASGAETNVFDCSFSVPDPAYLADTNDFVAENRHAAEQVLERLLRRKRQRDAANPEAGDGGRDIESEDGQRKQPGNDDRENFSDSLAKQDDRAALIVRAVEGS